MLAKKYEDLEIYKSAFELAAQIHKLSLKFPRSDKICITLNKIPLLVSPN